MGFEEHAIKTLKENRRIRADRNTNYKFIKSADPDFRLSTQPSPRNFDLEKRSDKKRRKKTFTILGLTSCISIAIILFLFY